MNLVKFHRLFALLSFRLEEFAQAGMPEGQRLKVRQFIDAAAAQVMALKGELKDTAAFFRGEGLDFIVFKGFSLAQTVYPAGEIRYFADNDLLVKPENLPLAEKLLKSRGYRLIKGWHSGFDIEVSSRCGISRPLMKEGAPYLQMDLHPGLTLGPGLRLAQQSDFWESDEFVQVEQERYKTLPPEIHLLYLCWHALKHPVFRLIWFRDLRLFLLKYPNLLQDGQFHLLLRKYRSARIVETAFKITEEIFQDSSFTRSLKQRWRCEELRKPGFFRTSRLLEPRADLPPLKRLRRDLVLIESYRGKAAFIFDFFFPQPLLLADLPKKVSSRTNLRYIRKRVAMLLGKRTLMGNWDC